MDDDTLLTTDQVAERMKVQPSRLRKARVSGIGSPPFIKIGHLVRYPLGDFRRWLEYQQRSVSTSEQRPAQ